MRYLSVLLLLFAGLTHASDYNFHTFNESGAPVSITTDKCSNDQLLLRILVQNTGDYRIKYVDIYATAISPKSKFIRGGFGFRQAVRLEPGKSHYFERYEGSWEKIAAEGDDIIIHVADVGTDATTWRSSKHQDKDWREKIKALAAAPCTPD